MLGRKKSAEKLKVVAVRIDPAIERRLRFLATATGRKPSFFLQQLIEGGISALEEVWMPPDLLAQVRAGTVPEPTVSHAAPDLFDETAFDAPHVSANGAHGRDTASWTLEGGERK